MELKALYARHRRAITKTLLIMKFTAIILLTACLTVSAKGDAQRITISEKGATLEKIFQEIKRQTGYTFVYRDEWLQQAKQVDLHLKDVSVEEALEACFKDQPLTYAIVKKTVVVKQKDAAIESKETNEKNNLPPEPVEITGRITNAQGEPMAGANVILKRTGKGTIADANGSFKLKAVNNDDIIVISFIGYKTQSIKVGDRTNFTLILDVALDKLDEVVVQAYGKTTDRLNTGNIGRITAEEIQKQPVNNIMQALQGHVAGAVITQTTGFSSSTIKVEIRGRSNINPNSTSEPLYIIDGVPLTILDVSKTANYENGSQGAITTQIYSPANGQSPFFTINPLDIESIEVLKDADATAIYGSRGANGVILITTKKGKAAKTHIDINFYQGISEVTRYYKMLKTQQYVEMRKEALINDGLPININTAPDLVAWDTTRYTDWQRYLWGGKGKTTDFQVSMSGGDSRTTFRLGGGYRRETDISTMKGFLERTSFSLSLTHKSANQRASVSLTSVYTYAAINDLTSWPISAVTLPPNAPAVWDNRGKLNYSGWGPIRHMFPFRALLSPYNSKTNFLNSTLSFNYELTKGLVVRSTFGYNYNQANQLSLEPIASMDPNTNPTGNAKFGKNHFRNLIIEPQIEYNGFIKKGKLNILVGGTTQRNFTEGISLNGFGYTNDVLLTSFNNAPTKITVSFEGEYKYAAIFGRINYNLKNKYILNLNARRDGSSRFGPGKQFGNFGSVGAAYIFSEEGWIKKHIPFLSFGKIRASYGTTGNDQNIGDYRFLTQWSFVDIGTYNGSLPLVPQGHTDSLLHWEVNRKTEIGLNLGFIQDRITVAAARYRNRCDNQLVPFPTPAFSGFTSVTSNSPADVENTGWEFILNSKIIDNKKFSWSSTFNIGFNRNKLLDYPNLSQSPYAADLVIGQSLNLRRLLHYNGVDPQTGLYIFEDKNKDGQLTLDFSGKTPDDRYFVDLSPKFVGGFSNNFNYKNWELSFFFYFKKQIGRNALNPIEIPGSVSNAPADVMDRWQKPGDNTGIARFTTFPFSNPSFIYYRFISDAVYTDASFIRLQNLSVAYNLSEKVTNKLRIKHCKFYLRGQNLFVITKYKGIDPEVQNFGVMPIPRTFVAGLSCNF